jgi:hypothetical protein
MAVVYIEVDWSREASGATEFGPFRFGETTLATTRQVLGSNGFTFERLSGGTSAGVDGSIKFINSYEVAGGSDAVITFETRISPDEVKTLVESADKTGTAHLAKLDALILARLSYLEEIWGRRGRADPAYKAVHWPE